MPVLPGPGYQLQYLFPQGALLHLQQRYRLCWRLRHGLTAIPCPLIMDSALNTIAHEIVHNWPALDGPTGEIEWFAEGTAEFYSMAIPLRAGIGGPGPGGPMADGQDLKLLQQPPPGPTQQRKRSTSSGRTGTPNAALRPGVSLPAGAGPDAQSPLRRGSDPGRAGALYCGKSAGRGRRSLTLTGNPFWRRSWARRAVEDFRQVMGGKVIEPSEDWCNGAFTFTRGTLGGT